MHKMKISAVLTMIACTFAVSLAAGLRLSTHIAGVNDMFCAATEAHIAHDIVGTVVLLAGIAAFLLPKGRKWHIRVGRFYLVAMIALAGSIVPILLAEPSALQMELTVLALYLALTGVMQARNRAAPTSEIEPAAPPWIAITGSELRQVLLAFALLGFTAAAALTLLRQTGAVGADVWPTLLMMMVTGCLGVCDLPSAPPKCCGSSCANTNKSRIRSHVLRMTGSWLVLMSAGFYNICSATHALPVVARWLIPTACSAVALFLAVRLFLGAKASRN